MSNEEFTTVTTITSPEPTEQHREFGNNLMASAFGLNDDVVEAKAVVMLKTVNGDTTFTTVDFDRNREVKLACSTRDINGTIYGHLSSTFDKMVENMSNANQQIEG